MSLRSLLDTVLLLVILGLLLDRPWLPSSRFAVGGDITGFAPPFGQQITTFAPDHLFVPENGSAFFTDAVQAKWLSLKLTSFHPAGLGYLHCLHAILQTVAAYASSQPGRAPGDGAWHVAHCVDYLRQAIVCAGDVALEGQQTTFPPGVVGSDGWDARHVCRDWGQVRAHLERNRADDRVWI
ncbi:hypothetical protein BT67DRAFT_379503 [Trichocladium antarcticum]|uniref:Oxidase ustYa n=1 Tax=Trichocladium antarcticum TaxID=1450529 RepID=A0AAN6UL30_9PEZI|nr:hypothetical protein BT67DRAFT_379503 [Trichocladium antarcticum]